MAPSDRCEKNQRSSAVMLKSSIIFQGPTEFAGLDDAGEIAPAGRFDDADAMESFRWKA
jgi:hypothetical protein